MNFNIVRLLAKMHPGSGLPIQFYKAAPISTAGTGGNYGSAIFGNTLFICDITDAAVMAWNISNPANPTIISVLKDATKLVDASECDISPDGQFLFVCTSTGSARGLAIVSIADPTNMSVVGVLNSASTTDTRGVVYLDTTFLALSDGTSGFMIVNWSTPASPTISFGPTTFTAAIGTCRNLARADAAGNKVCLISRTGSKLVNIDTTNRAAPSISGSVTNAVTLLNGIDVVVNAAFTRAYVCGPATREANPPNASNAVQIVDISMFASPALLGFVQDKIKLDGVRRMFLSPSNKYLYYATNNRDSVGVIDVLTNENAPLVVTEQLGSPHVTSTNPKSSQLGAVNMLTASGTNIFAGSDFPTYGWLAELDGRKYP